MNFFYIKSIVSSQQTCGFEPSSSKSPTSYPHYGVFKTSQDGKTKSFSDAFNASAKTASRKSFCSSDEIYETTLCNIRISSILCIFVFTTNVCAKFIVKL